MEGVIRGCHPMVSFEGVIRGCHSLEGSQPLVRLCYASPLIDQQSLVVIHLLPISLGYQPLLSPLVVLFFVGCQQPLLVIWVGF